MYEYLIYNQLKKYSKAGRAFHMPGHKARGEFAKLFPVAGMDVTELSYSDNLACPDGVIAEAQRDIASILGAASSYILTDGSSLGVFAMLYAASKRGTKVIVPRNCHQSVWNACRILGLEPVVVQGKTENGVIEPPETEVITRLIVNDSTVAGLIVTSPDYYGNIAPLKEYAEILKRNNRILMVDGAHGSHLAFEPERQGYAGVYADIWVDGAHKSLSTLTQGAILNISDTDLIADAEEGLSLFRTTSPSYPVMASVEYGVKQLANKTNLCAEAKDAAKIIREEKKITLYPSADWTKVAVDCAPYKISADRVAKELEKRNIYCELSDGRYVLFYLSPSVAAGDIKGLIKALKSVLSNKKLAGTYRPRIAISPANRTYSFQYALNKPSEWVPLEEAVGRMCAQNAGLTPPCIPVCVAGEVITDAAVRTLQSGKTYGLSGGKIKAVKK
ncbi:MAG: aminotransferase class I/II-fold pyridoxal phosphate-dependent enzyme [Clostridiales bacterium]|nr:aminotransferase class I/II-fold pyridoxal phosphate-dependent enzyme [Clostridiales bacterium]